MNRRYFNSLCLALPTLYFLPEIPEVSTDYGWSHCIWVRYEDCLVGHGIDPESAKQDNLVPFQGGYIGYKTKEGVTGYFQRFKNEAELFEARQELRNKCFREFGRGTVDVYCYDLVNLPGTKYPEDVICLLIAHHKPLEIL